MNLPTFNLPDSNVDIPASFDWREQTPNPVTPIKDQGQCGSCWAFSAVEEIESVWILTGHNVSILSPQQVVDCDTGSDGCNGGDPSTAYAYVMKVGGLESESAYPYTGKNGKCEATGVKIATITSWAAAIVRKNETELQNVLAQIAPLSICADASTWSSYTGGVLTKCPFLTELDHCIQLTGYGTDSTTGLDYWTVRNSWGTDWGLEGYIQIVRGKNMCGIADEVTVVTANKI